MLLISLFISIYLVNQCFAIGPCEDVNSAMCNTGYCSGYAGCSVARQCRHGVGNQCLIRKRSYEPLPRAFEEVVEEEAVPHQRKRP